VSMKNIGLPKNVAYACLAETIVLALEGRFENFTVGRNIEWEKVREIYRVGRKHGMELAAISGVNGPFSDADIRRVRKLALAARAKAAETAAEAAARAKARAAARHSRAAPPASKAPKARRVSKRSAQAPTPGPQVAGSAASKAARAPNARKSAARKSA
jgi:hypothetical protein